MIIKKRFTFIKDTVAPNLKTPIVFSNKTMSIGEVLDKLNELSDENEQLKHHIEELRNELNNCEVDEEKELDLSLPNPKKNLTIEELLERLNMQDIEIKTLRKELHLVHMSSMFSTVKSFKGDVNKRYKYSKKTDTIYDTANNYGQYDKILDKKEVTMLLNEYNTLLEESNEE